jgi:uncharacterized iron-regulated membrane protein
MMSTSMEATRERPISTWHVWLRHPEQLWMRQLLFQVHTWIGIVAGLYILVMSLSGSMIVYRNELERNPTSWVVPLVEWLVDFHDNLRLGTMGRSLNGIGATCLTLLCLTGCVLWWPGITYWRRSLTVNWRSSFARLNWDFHNSLGFWCFLFVAMWGISGIYFAFPQVFNAMVDVLDPGSADKLRFGDKALSVLSDLHFGRFGTFAEAVWALVGLVPAVLSFTGVFMCCHRLLVRKGAPLSK